MKRTIPKLQLRMLFRYRWLFKIGHRLSLLLIFPRLIAHGKKGAGGGCAVRLYAVVYSF
ncbi:hypothetical protein [Alloprevotella tannerae]|uniref:Uncharacterized protein n=1 Tax=Alloprevotella tannerae ATCC 51259 TaxID=626522 RepID=C9LKH2_9BACT|nr:hypothetical protein [Alloprevotella tannerae]EEX70694.1 hypothetical protein GCWU000325_02738 [Alloprevotella tannerae ATCC 51259]